jgi:hypothetical protein
MDILPPLELPGVYAKIARAKEHRSILKSEVESWVKSNPYVVAYKVNAQRTRWRVVLAEKRPFDGVRWALILGDLIHNLRSALDHLYYAVAERYAVGRLVDDEEIRQRKFPMAPDPKKFADFKRKRSVGIPDRVWDIIEDQQPYKRRNRHAAALFADINRLDNVDKHHMLHVMAASTHEVVWSSADPTVPVSVTNHTKLFSDLDSIQIGEDLIVITTMSALAADAKPEVRTAYSVHVRGFPQINLGVMVDAMTMIVERTVDDVAFFAR